MIRRIAVRLAIWLLTFEYVRGDPFYIALHDLRRQVHALTRERDRMKLRETVDWLLRRT